MNISFNTKLITAVVPKGAASGLQKSLIEQWQVHANICHGRGVGRAGPMKKRGIGEQQEKEILEVIVDAAKADDIFEFVFFHLELDKKPGGVVYMHQQQKSSVFELPQLQAES
jgi:hypothetical protein